MTGATAALAEHAAIPIALFADAHWSMTHSDDELALQEVARGFFERHSRITALRGQIDDQTGFDPAVWAQLSGELDILGLGIPERLNGSGGGTADACVLHTEAGRTLYTGPLLASTGLAASVLLCTAGTAGSTRSEAVTAQLLAEIARGAVATVSVVDPIDPAADSFAAVRSVGDTDVDDLHLDGHCPIVLDAMAADFLVVPITHNGGPALAVVRSDAKGLTRAALPAFDQSRHFGSVTLSGTPAALLAEAESAPSALSAGLDRTAILLAAEQAGVAGRCLELAVDYAKTRTQFGQPIGRFQALKHMLADVQTSIEATTTLVLFASRAVDAGSPDVPQLASMAKAWSSEAAVDAANVAVQVFGGIGFTWECDAHFYLKRAESDLLLLGAPRFHREELVRRIGL